MSQKINVLDFSILQEGLLYNIEIQSFNHIKWWKLNSYPLVKPQFQYPCIIGIGFLDKK